MKAGRVPQGPALFPSSQREVISHTLRHAFLITEVVCCALESVSQTACGFLGLATMVISLRAERKEVI